MTLQLSPPTKAEHTVRERAKLPFERFKISNRTAMGDSLPTRVQQAGVAQHAEVDLAPHLHPRDREAHRLNLSSASGVPGRLVLPHPQPWVDPKEPGVVKLKFTAATQDKREDLLRRTNTVASFLERDESPLSEIEDHLSPENWAEIEKLKKSFVAEKKKWKELNKQGNAALSDPQEKKMEKVERRFKTLSKKEYLKFKDALSKEELSSEQS